MWEEHWQNPKCGGGSSPMIHAPKILFDSFSVTWSFNFSWDSSSIFLVWRVHFWGFQTPQGLLGPKNPKIRASEVKVGAPIILDLNLLCFEPRGPSWKILQSKIFFFAENISCCTNISGQLCQQTKNFFLLTFRDNGGHQFGAKIHIFRIFWPLDGIGEVWKLETSKLDSPFQKSSS